MFICSITEPPPHLISGCSKTLLDTYCSCSVFCILAAVGRLRIIAEFTKEKLWELSAAASCLRPHPVIVTRIPQGQFVWVHFDFLEVKYKCTNSSPAIMFNPATYVQGCKARKEECPSNIADQSRSGKYPVYNVLQSMSGPLLYFLYFFVLKVA